MDYSFSHYLFSKRGVDDRALNKFVLAKLKANIHPGSVSVIEVGAGIGDMPVRLLDWGILKYGTYTAVEKVTENIEYASDWIPHWAKTNGLSVERIGKLELRIHDQTHDVRIKFQAADMFDYILSNPSKSDLLIAHAVLDLLPMPESLPKILSLTNGPAWLPINFDGVTTFEPSIDPELDDKIERLYHQSMDTRPTGGDSKTGRHLFEYLNSINVKILASGASDWVIHSVNGEYPADEKYFLQFVLHFFEESLSNSPELDAARFADWLSQRHSQIQQGELVYIAHQLDFLVQQGIG